MPLGPSGRARLLGGIVLVVMFAAGGLGGAAMERVLSAREMDPQVTQDRDRSNGEIDCERYRQRRRGPYGSLGLSDEQAAQIDRIFEEQRTRMDAFWADAGPRMNTILDETREQVRGVLTEEQREQNDRNRAERARRETERQQQDSIRRAEIRARCGEPEGTSPLSRRRP